MTDTEALLKDLRWRMNDIRDMLMTRRHGGDGESIYGCDEWSTPTVNLQTAINVVDKALAALSAEQPAGEAVAWANPVILLPADEDDPDCEWEARVKGHKDSTFSMPLYASPIESPKGGDGLTDAAQAMTTDQIIEARKASWSDARGQHTPWAESVAFARAIEAHHGIGVPRIDPKEPQT